MFTIPLYNTLDTVYLVSKSISIGPILAKILLGQANNEKQINHFELFCKGEQAIIAKYCNSPWKPFEEKKANLCSIYDNVER